MFKLCQSVNTVDVPADQVVHLFRSMRDVQLALPGLHAQQASAYICQYEKESGVCTVAVFHLHKSNLLAFYFDDPPIVPADKTDSMLDQGLNFIESMGFLMTDQDIHLLEAADRDMLWSSLPLRDGLQPEKGHFAGTGSPLAAAVVVEPPAAVASTAVTSSAEPLATKAVNPQKEEVRSDAASDKVDDLLAAVEAMRAKRPGLRARRTPPTNEEMNRRRQQLRESVGRILASL